MKLIVKHQRIFTQVTVYFATVTRILLNILVVITTLALAMGVVKSGYDLLSDIHKPLSTLLQNILLDIVFILALVEVTITVLGYLKDGRVHVRYIVDTILIIMLNEVVRLWFKQADLQQSISISVVIATLAAVRISVVKFAPDHED
ncbi:MAG TPA: phosphate-starvation-inducible PsiE family protein [Candidatus Saccharimonadales bacterium]|nr:phosphate-starvation-inducible PsiE family protein [Candidatus Saccharimonadales bacterium]